MPYQLQENADISMACFDAPCDEQLSHRALICASPRAISNPLQLLLQAKPPPLLNEINHFDIILDRYKSTRSGFVFCPSLHGHGAQCPHGSYIL